MHPADERALAASHDSHPQLSAECAIGSHR
jgi:hypothetical protein